MTSTPTSSDSSQMPLTPDITGDDSIPDKKQRRQTAIYPNTLSSPKSQKPFSRSAAKRESVMALGSIEHLQYYFTKTGLTAQKSALTKSTKALVPAIGGLDQLNAPKPIIEQLPELRLPPTPTPPDPPRPAFPNVPKDYETNPESLLPSVIHNLSAVERLWSISLAQDTTTPTQSLDVLDLLKTTTQAIRQVRNYLVSLPDDSAGTLRANFRPMSLPSIAHPNLNKARSAVTTPDPLTLIRRAALDVLTALRQLEESARLAMSDDPFDIQNEPAPPPVGSVVPPESRPASSLSAPENSLTATRTRSRSRSPHPQQLPNRTSISTSTSTNEPSSPSPSTNSVSDAFSFSLVHIHRDGQDHFVPVWDADDSDDFALSFPDETDGPDHERRDPWDARLVLSAGWLYRNDLELDTLKHERVVVGRYLDVVDAVLFGGARDGMRGWARAGRGVKERRDGRRRASDGDGHGQYRGGLKPGTSRRAASAFGDDSMVLREEPEELDSTTACEEWKCEEGNILGEDEEGAVPDEHLPRWAQRSAFPNDELARAHALLTTFLPVSLLPWLAPLTTTEETPNYVQGPFDTTNAMTLKNRRGFLQSLSSGQLLCVAYNACIRRSRKPWGYISADAIHDIIGLQSASGPVETGAVADQLESRGKEREIEGEVEKGKKGWTFRRTDNLRKWAGTLRLRYLLPIVIPLPLSLPIAPNTIPMVNGTSKSTSANSKAHTPSKIGSSAITGTVPTTSGTGTGSNNLVAGTLVFDPSMVARGEEGWEDMLEDVLLRWVAAVVNECRGEA